MSAPSAPSLAMPTPVMAAADYLADHSPVATKSSESSARNSKQVNSLLLSPPPSPFSPSDYRSTDPPIFASSPAQDTSDMRIAMFRPLVDVVRNASAPSPGKSVAKTEEYFQSLVYEQYSKSPKRWLHAQREFLKLYRPHFATVIAVSTPSGSRAALGPRSSKISKLRSQPAAHNSPALPIRNSFSSPRVPSRASPGPRAVQSPIKRVSASPDVSPRVSVVHDIEVEEVPDFCPPLSSLDNSRGMRTDWKGNQMDLSTDPDRHLLHPYELQLASVLRLPCSMYLDSKKRIFAERVFRARKGLQFRRTDSQKACRIDVNKATRLFVAFEKVGWFDDKWIEPYL